MEFRKSDKSLKHELDSIKDLVSHMSCWCCGSIFLVFNTRGTGWSPFNANTNIEAKHLGKTSLIALTYVTYFSTFYFDLGRVTVNYVSRKPQYKDVYRRTIEMLQRARIF